MKPSETCSSCNPQAVSMEHIHFTITNSEHERRCRQCFSVCSHDLKMRAICYCGHLFHLSVQRIELFLVRCHSLDWGKKIAVINDAVGLDPTRCRSHCHMSPSTAHCPCSHRAPPTHLLFMCLHLDHHLLAAATVSHVGVLKIPILQRVVNLVTITLPTTARSSFASQCSSQEVQYKHQSSHTAAGGRMQQESGVCEFV